MRRKFSLFFAIGLLAVALSYSQSDVAGPTTQNEILAARPDWQDIVARYIPSDSAIQKLKDIHVPVQVEVFLGTWCSDSKAHVSALFKILSVVDSPLITATFIGVPKDKTLRGPYIEGKDIQRLPTFIVSVDGQEVGRIIETPAKSVEQDIVDLLER